ncbi:MAG TPA: hypothetical protein DCQ93_03885, partial [Bacteroidetes bacterium]|nr:hypothetical protein [Bacteroidota bacterium]
FYTCWFDQNAIADGKVTPLYPVLPYNPPMHGNFPLTNYIEVFSDDFDETDFSDDVTLNYGDISKIWYDWGRQGNDTFPVWANIPIVNNYYTQNEINLTDNHNLILPLTKLSFPYWTDPDIHMLRKYSLSIITTTSKFYHGYFEIRAKLPNDYGDWPAFWLIDGSCLSNGDHDDYREIDFFDAYSEPENELPQGIIMNACADSYHAWISCVQHDGGGLGYYNFNLSDEYHIYGCSWTQDNISFYIDNVLIASNPNSLVNDQRMYLVLNNAIEPWLGENLDVYGTGESSPKRDFKVDYVKVYQKVDDMFNIYGVEDCNGKKLETLDFPVETGIPSSWRYRMDCGNDFRSLGYTYQWISSDPSNLHIYGSANLPSVYFYGTAIGTYTLTLHVSPPSSGIFNFYYERTIDINIVSVPDLTTHIHHNQIGNSCSFNFYYDAVPDATKIMVSEDGGITFYESSSTEIGDFPVAELGTDFDFVVRAYYYSCLFYEATSSITLYPPEGCYDRRENNELAVNSKSDSLLVFPSPSNGNLFILNKSNKNLKIFFYTLSKKEILQIRLRPNEIQKINNIPFGVLILEAINEENSFIFDRKLVPVIEVD